MKKIIVILFFLIIANNKVFAMESQKEFCEKSFSEICLQINEKCTFIEVFWLNGERCFLDQKEVGNIKKWLESIEKYDEKFDKFEIIEKLLDCNTEQSAVSVSQVFKFVFGWSVKEQVLKKVLKARNCKTKNLSCKEIIEYDYEYDQDSIRAQLIFYAQRLAEYILRYTFKNRDSESFCSIVLQLPRKLSS